MSDAIKEYFNYKEYIFKHLQSKIDTYKIKLCPEKLRAMIKKLDNTGKMECFCGINKPCPCDKVNEDLEKYSKCHCNFIKAVK